MQVLPETAAWPLLYSSLLNALNLLLCLVGAELFGKVNNISFSSTLIMLNF